MRSRSLPVHSSIYYFIPFHLYFNIMQRGSLLRLFCILYVYIYSIFRFRENVEGLCCNRSEPARLLAPLSFDSFSFFIFTPQVEGKISKRYYMAGV